MIRLLLVAGSILVAAGGLGAGGVKKDANKDDMDKLQGEWAIVSADACGESFPELKGKKVLVKGSEWTTPANRNGSQNHTFTFDIDATKNPKQIDFSLFSLRRETCPAIYKIDGNTLTICRSFPKCQRPTEFKAGSTAFLMVCKRAEK